MTNNVKERSVMEKSPDKLPRPGGLKHLIQTQKHTIRFDEFRDLLNTSNIFINEYTATGAVGTVYFDKEDDLAPIPFDRFIVADDISAVFAAIRTKDPGRIIGADIGMILMTSADILCATLETSANNRGGSMHRTHISDALLELTQRLRMDKPSHSGDIYQLYCQFTTAITMNFVVTGHNVDELPFSVYYDDSNGAILDIEVLDSNHSRILAHKDDQIALDMTSTIINMCLTSLYNLLLSMQDTKKFVFEEAPISPRKYKPGGKPLLVHERPLYTILSPKQCRRYLRVDDPTNNGSKKAPHERRGHYRTFHSDRFKNKQGETIYIKPHWVGTSEVKRGGHIYRVRLDL